MPSITLKREILFRKLNLQMSDDAFSDMIFDFGLELDDIINENNMVSYKIDIPANRYDLLCLEGLVMALRSYKLADEYEDLVESQLKVKNHVTTKKPDYNFTEYDLNLMQNTMGVIHQNKTYRKFIACAVIKGINFDDDKYESFIDYQDKLHLSIGRNRSIVAIGTHDMSRIQFPVFYKTLNKDEIRFQPLNQDKCMNGEEILSFYGKDTKMKKYCNLFPDEYPCFIDANGNVLSLPPLINSEYTKITNKTRDIFVEVTGTDEHKVNTVLKMILYNFRGKSFSKINILKDYLTFEDKCINICECEGRSSYTTPIFMEKTYTLKLDKVNSELGLSLKLDELFKILVRMMHTVVIHRNEIVVRPSDVRSDVLHYVDILEDIAIAYGFNNFKRKTPNLYTVGTEDPFIKFSDKIRTEMTCVGYNELLTLSLLSKSQIINDNKYVSLSNPKSTECETVRNSLLPGVLKAIHSNQHVGGIMKVFEVSDVVIVDSLGGIKNQKDLCICYSSQTDGLDHILGVVSLIASKLRLSIRFRQKDFNQFFEKRGAEVVCRDVVIGMVGVINPVICNDFKIPFAMSSVEINLNALYEIYQISLKNVE